MSGDEISKRLSGVATEEPRVSTQPQRLSQRRVAWITIFVFAVLLLFPVWSVKYLPLLDYPNHLASGYILGHLHDPAHNFGDEFSSAWGLNPYVGVDFTFMTLGRVMSPYVAGKLVLSFGLLLFPAGAWFFLRQANPGQDSLAVWALLGAYNIFFFYGFVGYFCSMGLMFLALGLWMRWLEKHTIALWLLTCLTLTVTYLTHIFGWVFAGYIIGVYSLTRPRLREWIRSALLFLPSGVCYLVSSRAISRQNGFEFRPKLEKFQTFWTIIQGYTSWLDWVTIAAVAGLFVLAWWGNRAFGWNRRWIFIAAAMLIAYVFMPVGYGDAWDIDIRALPVLFVLLLAMARVGQRGWRLAPIAVLLFVIRIGDVNHYFHKMQPELVGIAQSFTMTPENAKVLPVSESSGEDAIYRFYGHFWAYGVIDRGWYSPYMFRLPGLLPLEMTKELYDPDGFWDLSYDNAPDWKQVRDDYDYVWAWDVDKFEPGLNTVGDAIYRFDRLVLYKMRK